MRKYDFSGWATRANIRCSDGRTIMPDAFKDDDGKTVPLVWNHQHNEPENVLGHALLRNMGEGVYAYCSFNDTERGQHAKNAVEHGDVTALSIYANQLKQQHGEVLHGAIREVSLVLAGANPEAFIDSVVRHGVEYDDEAVMFFNEPIDLAHADEEEDTEDGDSDEETVADVFNAMSEKQKKVVYYMVGQAMNGETVSHAEEEESEDGDSDEETVADVFNAMSEKQKNVVYYMVGQAVAGQADEEDSDEGEREMKHNVFDGETGQAAVLSHSDITGIFEAARRGGSLKAAVHDFMEANELAHADDEERPIYNIDADGNHYGITDVDYLFPEYRNLNNPPEFIQRDMGWVSTVMNGVHHTPFSRIKSQFANITEDEARAKGYMKGNKKKDEVFSLLKRTTDPQTIYKRQKMDRDDILDITDFDVVAWIKREMRMMLDEEIARAILIGDGRLSSDEDKIHEEHVRPIATDNDLFTIKVSVTDPSDPRNIIRAVIRARKNYKGSGSPTFFTTEDALIEMLLLEDGIGHPLYADEAALARKLRVANIVTVPVMEGHKIDGKDCYGVIVNLKDYNVGADKGAAVEMFDDFDLDYNRYRYLIETRISGALTKPYSAMVITAATASEAVDDGDNNG